MQIVKWGKKQRQVKVPVGWAFIRDGKEIKRGDMFFNLATHCWNNVQEEDIGCVVGVDFIDGVFIRSEVWCDLDEIDTDSHAVRTVLTREKSVSTSPFPTGSTVPTVQEKTK